MRRREFIGSLAGAALLGARTARAQTPGKTYRLGTFHPAMPMTEASTLTMILPNGLASVIGIAGWNVPSR